MPLRSAPVLLLAAAAAALGACRADTPIVKDVPIVREVLLPPPPFPAGWRVVDLTAPLDPAAPHVAHPREFPFERMEFPPADRGLPRTGAFTAMEHTGTHLSAPRTRNDAGASIDRFGGADLLVPLVVVDVPSSAATESAVGLDVLREDERRHGEIPAGAAVLLRTGASGAATAHAGWAGPSVRWLVSDRGARIVGTDAPAFDPTSAPRGPAEHVAATVGAWVLVGARRLGSVPRRGAYVVVGALPIAGASAAPARVVALVPPDAPAPPAAPAAPPAAQSPGPGSQRP